MICLLLISVIIIVLILISKPQNNEGYYLRDIPYGSGYGGYPPDVYGRYYATYTPPTWWNVSDLYGSPDIYGGYSPGAGLTW